MESEVTYVFGDNPTSKGVKWCIGCVDFIRIEDFSPDKRATSKLKSSCKKCCNEYRRIWMQAHPGKTVNYSKNFREKKRGTCQEIP